MSLLSVNSTSQRPRDGLDTIQPYCTVAMRAPEKENTVSRSNIRGQSDHSLCSQAHHLASRRAGAQKYWYSTQSLSPSAKTALGARPVCCSSSSSPSSSCSSFLPLLTSCLQSHKVCFSLLDTSPPFVWERPHRCRRCRCRARVRPPKNDVDSGAVPAFTWNWPSTNQQRWMNAAPRCLRLSLLPQQQQRQQE